MSPRLSTGAFSSFPSTLLSHPARRTLSYRLKGCALSCFGLKHKISCFLVCLPSPTHVTPQSVLRGSTHLSVALKAFLTPQGWVRAIPTGTSVSLVLGAGRLRSPCAVGLKAPAGLVHSPQGKWTEGTLCWRLAQGASQAAQWFKKKNKPACWCRRYRFGPLGWKIPWKRNWQPTSVFLSGELHRQRSLLGYIHGVSKSWTRLSEHTCTPSPGFAHSSCQSGHKHKLSQPIWK